MTKDQINIEYLTNYDFQVYVNKCCQSYHKSPEYIMASPVTAAYCESLQEGGCNAKREDRGADNKRASTTAAARSCQT